MSGTTIRISEVLALLDRGKSRKEIAEHYGKTEAEMQRSVWSHPKLKGRKAKKVDDILLEDDVEGLEPLEEGQEEEHSPEYPQDIQEQISEGVQAVEETQEPQSETWQ